MTKGHSDEDGHGFRQSRSFVTRAGGTIYRHGGDPIPLVGLTEGALAPGVGAPLSLVSVHYSGRLGLQAANFSLEVKAGDIHVFDEVKAGDWVTFHWNRAGKLLHGSVGLIVAVRRQRSSAGGAVAESWILECQSWARVLNKTQVWFDDYTAFGSNVGGKILASRMGFVPGGSPDQMVMRIIDAWLGTDGVVGGAWKMPKGLDDFGEAFVSQLFVSVQGGTPEPLVDAIARAGVLRGEMFDESALFQPNPGTMLAPFLDEWSNPLLNEMWFDVGDADLMPGRGFGALESDPRRSAPVLFIREKPFVNVVQGMASPWFKLPTVELSRDAILTDNVATNDDERVNLLQLNAVPGSMINFEQYALFPPSYDASNAALHGLRKYERMSKFASFGGRTEGLPWMEELRMWHTLVASWYGPNHLWMSGTIQVPFLLGEARPGKRLVVGHGAHREQFYIEGVTHGWKHTQKGNTTLTVTRGFRGSDEELLEAVDTAQRVFQRRATKVGVGLPREGNVLNLRSGFGLGPGEDIA